MSSRVEVGDRVRLLSLSDDWSDLKPGSLGTVIFIDDLGTVHVDWDSGSSLGLVPDQDSYEVLYHTDDS
jgi:hypothetical protein